MTDRKFGPKTADRGADGKFATGNAGKPRGARHRVTRAAEALLDGEAETITRACTEAAKAGDPTALRLAMERICPPRRDAPVTTALPRLETTGDALKAIDHLVQAAANGELTPGEASRMVGLVEAFRKTAEVEALERRLEALEAAQERRGGGS